MAQQLELQQGAAAEARDELQAARAENKDLIAQRTRDAAAVAAAEDMRRQWETAQACALRSPCVWASLGVCRRV